MKAKTFIILPGIIALCFIYSCNKTDMTDQLSDLKVKSNAIARTNVGRDKTQEPLKISYEIKVGHRASDCGNACETTWGVNHHVDCQGPGDACIISGVIVTNYPKEGRPLTNSKFDATEQDEYALTDREYFLFPARSVLIVENPWGESEIWLNIPAQILTRNPETNCFIYVGLYFSDTPHFRNE